MLRVLLIRLTPYRTRGLLIRMGHHRTSRWTRRGSKSEAIAIEFQLLSRWKRFRLNLSFSTETKLFFRQLVNSRPNKPEVGNGGNVAGEERSS